MYGDYTEVAWLLILGGIIIFLLGLILGIILGPYTIKPPKGRHCTGPQRIVPDDRQKASQLRRNNW